MKQVTLILLLAALAATPAWAFDEPEGAVKAKELCKKRGNPAVVLSDFRGEAEFVLYGTVKDKKVVDVQIKIVKSSVRMSSKAYRAYVQSYKDMALAYGCQRDGVFKQKLSLKVGL